MIDPMLSILGVIAFSGLLGGMVNYDLTSTDEDQSSDDQAVPLGRFKSIIMGLCASMMVPLFLNVISSKIVDEILGINGAKQDLSRLLILAGLCLIASISSRAFITTISDRLLNMARDAKREAHIAGEAVKAVKEDVQPLIAKETEAETGAEASVAPKSIIQLTDTEKQVMLAFIKSDFSLRSLGGIAKDSGLAQFTSQKVLEMLVEKGCVSVRPGKNGPRWFLTVEGRERTNGIQQGNGAAGD